jgi:hypothetical protein
MIGGMSDLTIPEEDPCLHEYETWRGREVCMTCGLEKKP